MQPIAEIEASYQTPDPWGFRTHPDDQERKRQILKACTKVSVFERFTRALEIGAGEGFIAEDLPAKEIHGLEVSSTARSRMAPHIIPRERVGSDERFDLVVVPGVLYPHYDIEAFFQILRKNASMIVVTCNIAAWEDPRMSSEAFLIDSLGLRQHSTFQFAYREFEQRLRILWRPHTWRSL